MHRKPSRFLSVKCAACDNEQIIYSHSKTEVVCFVCKEMLAEPTGGKAVLHGTVLNVLS